MYQNKNMRDNQKNLSDDLRLSHSFRPSRSHSLRLIGRSGPLRTHTRRAAGTLGHSLRGAIFGYYVIFCSRPFLPRDLKLIIFSLIPEGISPSGFEP